MSPIGGDQRAGPILRRGIADVPRRRYASVRVSAVLILGALRESEAGSVDLLNAAVAVMRCALTVWNTACR